MSAAVSALSHVAVPGGTAARISAHSLRVLTLTPFYPSEEDPSQGSFVAEPLRAIEHPKIRNCVIAVQPFYRPRLHAPTDEISSCWSRYLALPGNAGLATSGDLLALSIERQVRELHARAAFDLIHAHAALPCGHAAALLSRKLRIPFVVTVHGLDAYAERQVGRVWGKRCREKSAMVYSAARAVICISEKVRDQVGEGVDGQRVVIYNGVDANLFSPALESPTITVLSVGNLIPIKGHELLLRAFARVSGAVPGCRLEIVGNGPERTRLERLTRELCITGRVSFTGRQSRGSVAQAMKDCAVFALPSSYEGLGCVYLEAMSSGKPALGCTGQGIEEIIESGKNGMLVAPGSLEDLSAALQALLLDRDLRVRLGRAARAKILRGHTLEYQAAELCRVYRECSA